METRTEKVNTSHLCVVVERRVGEGQGNIRGEEEIKFCNVEEVDQTSASPEDSTI